MVTDQYHYGAIIKMKFDPQAGHEQAGWRPAIIISNDDFNQKSNLRFVCPITHTENRCVFHVKIEGCEKTDGVILCEQAKALDIFARKAVFVEDAPAEIIDEANALVQSILQVA
ncbi:MAG: type II toxin-antitoxin system PemK/MazF family toxin [Roseburia intestinalis]|jgi:toxin-antitoxin system, toxin component, mazF family|uniref:type II toxin-antitoxin system PemK/MazF family toxin n=1 Tax=Roseburia hominis TaxID=301301 RepID=UPI003999EEF8